jgi:hypothetical protein
MGPGRYRGRCRNALTNSDSKSYADTNSDPCCMRGDSDANTYNNPDGHANSNSNRNSNRDCYCNCNCYANSYSDSYCHSHSYCHTNCNTRWDSHADTYRKTYTYTKASPNTGASTVEILAGAKNSW